MYIKGKDIYFSARYRRVEISGPDTEIAIPFSVGIGAGAYWFRFFCFQLCWWRMSIYEYEQKWGNFQIEHPWKDDRKGNMYSGWVITQDHLYDDDMEIPSRVGWGQNDANAVHEECDQVVAFRITFEENLIPELIENPVQYRLVDEDGVSHYDGIISREWLDGDECLSFAPLRFGTADTGATIMEYRLPESSEWEVL